MRFFALLAALLLSIGHTYAQTYEEYIQKSYDFLDKNDLVSAEESIKAAMHLEPGNPTNYALLSNLGTIQRRQGIHCRVKPPAKEYGNTGEPGIFIHRTRRNGKGTE